MEFTAEKKVRTDWLFIICLVLIISIVGSFSVVLSGGYEDDEDKGDWFIYTGSGGRDLKYVQEASIFIHFNVNHGII